MLHLYVLVGVLHTKVIRAQFFDCWMKYWFPCGIVFERNQARFVLGITQGWFCSSAWMVLGVVCSGKMVVTWRDPSSYG